MVPWCWWIAAAWAASVSLPPGEDPEVWRDALEHADLRGDDGASVVIAAADDGRWRLEVRAAGGATREATVAPATDEAAREELALLAASLLRAAEQVSPVALPELPPVPAPAPAPGAPPAPAPAPAPADPESEGDGVAALPPVPRLELPEEAPRPTFFPPVPPEPVPPPSIEAPSVQGWARAGVGMALRARVRTVATASVWAGAGGTLWKAGGGVELGAPALLPVDDDSRMQASDLALGAWLTPWQVEVGAVVGGSRRFFSEEEWRAAAGLNSWLGLEGAVSIPVGTTRVRVWARGARDLRPTRLAVAGVVLRELDPWHGLLGLSVGTGRSSR